MALVYANPFTHVTSADLASETQPATIWAASLNIETVSPPLAWASTSRCFVAQGTGNRFHKSITPTPTASVSAWVYTQATAFSANRGLITLRTAANGNSTFQGWYVGITSSGQLALYSNSTQIAVLPGSPLFQQWVHYELAANQTSIRLYLNGVLTYTHTFATAPGNWNAAGLQNNTQSGGGTSRINYCELCIWDDDDGPHGPTRIESRLADATESNVNFAAVGATGIHETVDEELQDADTTYMECAAASAGEGIVSSSAPVYAGSDVAAVHGVVVQVCQTGDLGAGMEAVVEVSSTRAGVALPQSGTYTIQMATFPLNPSGGVAWTPATAEGAFFGVEKV